MGNTCFGWQMVHNDCCFSWWAPIRFLELGICSWDKSVWSWCYHGHYGELRASPSFCQKMSSRCLCSTKIITSWDCMGPLVISGALDPWRLRLHEWNCNSRHYEWPPRSIAASLGSRHAMRCWDAPWARASCDGCRGRGKHRLKDGRRPSGGSPSRPLGPAWPRIGIP